MHEEKPWVPKGIVMQKKLFNIDLNPQQAHLSIPPTKIANKFLTQTEEPSLDERWGKNKRLSGMSVMVLDPSVREYNMCFKKWETERSYVYNLTRGWNQILHHNDLKLGDMLQLWSFRISFWLCFTLVKMWTWTWFQSSRPYYTYSSHLVSLGG